MGCFGDKEKGEVDESQKWDYIALSDFKSNSFWTPLSYIWLWFLAIVAVAVYAADTFTAVNLLVFDKWSSKIEPAIPFKYSKWIFASTIIASWVLCGFEWVRAIRVMRRGGVAESYMDPLAVTLQSMRPQGWRRFLVFAELTKSKKGVDYIALFVYFNFKGSVRVVLAEGARQVVNAMTLYSVMEADIVPSGTHAATKGHSDIAQFFINIGSLYSTEKDHAIVLSSMLFTLVIWTISALSLLAALILYLVFLWHYIPESDGRLSHYCRRKIDRRLGKIVSQKVKHALEEQEKKQEREEAKAVKRGDMPAKPKRQPTLPQINGDDKLPAFSLARQDTQATLPLYSSPPPTREGPPSLQRQPTLPDVTMQPLRPGMLGRNGTQTSAFSNASYSSNAPLLGNAPDMSYSEDTLPPARQMPSYAYGARPPPGRFTTQSSQSSQQSFTSHSRPGTSQPLGFRLPVRTNTDLSISSKGEGSQLEQSYYRPPMRQDTFDSFVRPENALIREDSHASSIGDRTHEQQPTQMNYNRPSPPVGRLDTVYNAPRYSPSHKAYDINVTAQPSRIATASPFDRQTSPSRGMASGGYVAFNPSFAHAVSSVAPSPGSIRNLTASPARYDYFAHTAAPPQRSFTAPPPQHQSYPVDAYDDLLDDYSDERDNGRAGVVVPARSQTQTKRVPGAW